MLKHCVIILLHYLLVNSQLLEKSLNSVLKLEQPLNPDTTNKIFNLLPDPVKETLAPIQKIFETNGLTSTYNIKTVNYPTRKEYDHIIIGAGTAGSIVANRLSENENHNVLLIENGGMETLLSQIPIFVPVTFQTDMNYGYRIEKQKHACHGMTDQQCTWPRGKCLGGTSSINAMLYTRGNKKDYDLWEEMGNEGWSYDDLLPYFKKSEKCLIKDDPIDTEYHGYDGYLHVEQIPWRSTISKAYLEAGKELGYNITDVNGKEQMGFSYLPVNMDHGSRCSSARAFLRIERPNLDIVSHAFATKILIDDQNRAYGVEYVKNNQTRIVRASKEIISSAGTINGAQLLMLSGIGPKEHLEELGIKVIKDAKVGFNMYEHVATWGLLFETNSTEPFTISTILNPANALNYALKREGPYSSLLSLEVIAYIQTKYATDERPDMELLFFTGGLQSDLGIGAKKGYGISDEVYNQFFKPIAFKHYWSVWPILQHPKSVGRITLRSKDPFEAPILDPNFFSDPHDLDVIVEGIKLAIKISETKAMQKYNSKIYSRKMLGCESYEFGSDDYFKCIVKMLTVMENHEMGTCKMGNSSDPYAVVDTRLRVIGIEGLRVIDASIMPYIPTCHINAITNAIAEKGADMIKKDHKNNDSPKSTQDQCDDKK